jgi:hypothetical protein
MDALWTAVAGQIGQLEFEVMAPKPRVDQVRAPLTRD